MGERAGWAIGVLSESGFSGLWDFQDSARLSLYGKRSSVFVLRGFPDMGERAGWAKRNPENPANPVNPDSDKGAQSSRRPLGRADIRLKGRIVCPQSRACARHPHPSLPPSRGKGFVARYSYLVSSGGIGSPAPASPRRFDLRQDCENPNQTAKDGRRPLPRPSRAIRMSPR